jgi:hypothetical protein
VPRAAPRGQDVAELSGSAQPVVKGQHDGCAITRNQSESVGKSRTDSGRQLAATLAATGREDRSASTSPHPQSESVRLRSPTVVRLKGPLAHWSNSMLDRCYRNTWTGDDCLAARGVQHKATASADLATVRTVAARGQTSPRG